MSCAAIFCQQQSSSDDNNTRSLARTGGAQVGDCRLRWDGQIAPRRRRDAETSALTAVVATECGAREGRGEGRSRANANMAASGSAARRSVGRRRRRSRCRRCKLASACLGPRHTHSPLSTPACVFVMRHPLISVHQTFICPPTTTPLRALQSIVAALPRNPARTPPCAAPRRRAPRLSPVASRYPPTAAGATMLSLDVTCYADLRRRLVILLRYCHMLLAAALVAKLKGPPRLPSHYTAPPSRTTFQAARRKGR